MTQLDDAISALKAADAAGDVAAARLLADAVEKLSKEDAPKDSISGTVNQFGYGANEKIADVLAAPGRVANAVTAPAANFVANLFRDKNKPLELRDTQDVVTTSLRDSPAPQTPTQRVARRAGEEVGATLPYAAVPFMAAAAPAGRAATNVAERALQALVQGVRNTPGSAAVGELAATVGAGAGAGVAQEIAPGSQGAEIAGQLAGGVAPTALAYTPTAIISRLGRAAASRLSPAAQTRSAQQEVAKVLGPELGGPRAEAGLAEAEALREAIPGFSPSLAEATGSPSLIATQRNVEGGASGRELEAMSTRRAGSEAAIDRFAEDRAPKASNASPTYVIDEAANKVEVLRQDIARPEKSIAKRQQEAAGALPTVDRSAVGDTLRTKMVDIRSATSQRMNDLASELGINDVDVSVPFGRLRNEIVAEFSPKSVFDDAANAPEVLDVIKRISPVSRDIQTGQATQQTVKFSDLKALRERLSDDIMDAQSSANPSRKKIRNLVMLKEKVDTTIDSVADDIDPALSDNYRQFRETYFKDYIEPFEKGASFKVRQKDGRGFYRIPDEKVATAFFAPGDVSGARQFKAVYGADKEANDALAAVALDSLRDAAVRDGTINPTLLNTWKRKHESVLAEFPGVQRAVESLDKLTTALTQRQAQLAGRAKAVENAVLVKEINRMEGGGKTPEGVIDAALRDPRKMSQLTNRLRGNEDAMSSLRRTLWDRAIEGRSGDVLSFVKDNRQALSSVFNAGHLNDIQRIAKARQMLENVPAPKGAAFQANPLADAEKAIGMGVPQLASRFFAAESGRTSYRYIATDALGRFIRGRSKAESEALLKEALYDPTVARDLAALAFSKGDRPDVAKRLNVRLFNLGMGDEETADQE